MTIRHLLVPIDGSEPANRAVQCAVDLAAQTGARITFCHAVDVDAFYRETAAAGGYDVAPLIDEERQNAQSILGDAVQLAVSRGTSSEAKIEDGAARDVILRLERELGPDLLVMGTHGRRGLGRLFVGSTTEDVLRRSVVPVLAVPPPQAEPSEGNPVKAGTTESSGSPTLGLTY
jgi:nucleotide-binding universal stress UspA family protein